MATVLDMRVKIMVIVLLLTALAVGAADADKYLKDDVLDEFLYLADVAAEHVVKEPIPSDRFYVDSYGVRGLLVAYDMTNRQQYLEACKIWADRILDYQKKMVPENAYFMNYKRRPGETDGLWYVADSTSVAMAVLATSIRCEAKADRDRYINSVKAFTQLVLDNYVRPNGGVTDGIWDKSDDEWYCSTSLLSALCFQLYGVTGESIYKQTAMNGIDWMLEWDYNDTVALPFEKQWPVVVFYTLEGYNYGLPYYKPKSERLKKVYKKLSATTGHLMMNQQEDGFWGMKYNSWAGAKQCGMAMHTLIYSNKVYDKVSKSFEIVTPLGKQVTFGQMVQDVTSKSLRSIVETMSKNREYSHPLVYSMMSFAEFINPGAIYEKTRPESHCLNYSEKELTNIRKERTRRMEDKIKEDK